LRELVLRRQLDLLQQLWLPLEAGPKDTLQTNPGWLTKLRAYFDIPGLYVRHCHILDHEDNEMIRPYAVVK
jgi:FtsP/CotA-like multicopper oxidase with cupredoxin domain